MEEFTEVEFTVGGCKTVVVELAIATAAPEVEACCACYAEKTESDADADAGLFRDTHRGGW
jgi:hypothetical protein